MLKSLRSQSTVGGKPRNWEKQSWIYDRGCPEEVGTTEVILSILDLEPGRDTATARDPNINKVQIEDILTAVG